MYDLLYIRNVIPAGAVTTTQLKTNGQLQAIFAHDARDLNVLVVASRGAANGMRYQLRMSARLGQVGEFMPNMVEFTVKNGRFLPTRFVTYDGDWVHHKVSFNRPIATIAFAHFTVYNGLQIPTEVTLDNRTFASHGYFTISKVNQLFPARDFTIDYPTGTALTKDGENTIVNPSQQGNIVIVLMIAIGLVLAVIYWGSAKRSTSKMT